MEALLYIYSLHANAFHFKRIALDVGGGGGAVGRIYGRISGFVGPYPIGIGVTRSCSGIGIGGGIGEISVQGGESGIVRIPFNFKAGFIRSGVSPEKCQGGCPVILKTAIGGGDKGSGVVERHGI